MANSKPMMFQSDFFLGDQDQIAFGSLPHVLGLQTETPPNLYNTNFQTGMDVWKRALPMPTLYDSFLDNDMDETAQSQNEIVQKILLTPSKKSFEQHDFFFIKTDVNTTVKAHYSNQSKYPYTAVTLSDLAESLAGPTTIEKVVTSYTPMGVFFNYVDESTTGRESKIVAYSLGGLSDILNVWHVAICPGMELYFVVYVNNDNKLCLLPYAGLKRPMEDDEMKKLIKPKTNLAIINVGIVCASNNRVPLSATPNFYDPNKALAAKTNLHLDPKSPAVRGNILRIRMSCLKWELIYNF